MRGAADGAQCRRSVRFSPSGAPGVGVDACGPVCMVRLSVVAELRVIVTALALAAGPMETNLLVDGAGAPIGIASNPIQVTAMPFTRSGDPFILPAGQAPQQYEISQPVGTTSYRFVNPCSVDIRIKMAAMVLAAVNALAYHRFTERRIAQWVAGVPPSGARAAGLVSICVWAIVIVAGRMMSYTMF